MADRNDRHPPGGDRNDSGNIDIDDNAGPLPSVGDLKGKKWLNLDINWCGDWTTPQALREFAQNADDGMRHSFRINPQTQQIRWYRSPIKDGCLYAAVAVSREAGSNEVPSEQMGYIKYEGAEKHRLTVCNFRAKLEQKHFGVGYSSKRDRDDLAGCHGEGFKVAAVALMALDHDVEMWTNGSRCKFGYEPTYDVSTYCRMYPNKRGQTLPAPIYDPQHPSRGRFNYDKHEDTTVIVQSVTWEQFDSFVDQCLGLRDPQPTDVDATPEGQMILDAAYGGKVYINGLFVEGWQPNGRPYQLGYNINGIKIGRDRRRAEDPEEEQRHVVRSIAHAFEVGGVERKDKILSLWFEHKKCADIASMPEDMPKELAYGLLAHLRFRHPAAFFYPKDPRGNQDINHQSTTRSFLRLNPVALPEALWDALAANLTLRTPLAETIHLFERFPSVAPPDTLFAKTILRCLRACLALDPSVCTIPIEVVNGDDLGIKAHFKPPNRRNRSDTNLDNTANTGVFLVHRHCLDFVDVHEKCECSISSAARENPELTATTHFSCLHIINDLILEGLASYGKDDQRRFFESNQQTLRERVSSKLVQMPQDVQTAALVSGIKVSWSNNEPSSVQKITAHMTDHCVWMYNEATCSGLRDSLLLYDEEEGITCGCACQIVSQGRQQVTFDDLDPEKAYFAVVARAKGQAFFSLPTAALFPLRPQVDPTPTSAAPTAATPAPIQQQRIQQPSAPLQQAEVVPGTMPEALPPANAQVAADHALDSDEMGAEEGRGAGFQVAREERPARPSSARASQQPRIPLLQENGPQGGQVQSLTVEHGPPVPSQHVNSSDIASALIDLAGEAEVRVDNPGIFLRNNAVTGGRWQLVIRGRRSQRHEPPPAAHQGTRRLEAEGALPLVRQGTSAPERQGAATPRRQGSALHPDRQTPRRSEDESSPPPERRRGRKRRRVAGEAAD